MLRGLSAVLLTTALTGCATTYPGSSTAEREHATATVGPVASVAPVTHPAPPTPRPAAGPTLSSVIRDIGDAENLDEAVDGYAAGLAMDPGSAALHRAYLRRVVDLDAPQLGAAAAE